MANEAPARSVKEHKASSFISLILAGCSFIAAYSSPTPSLLSYLYSPCPPSPTARCSPLPQLSPQLSSWPFWSLGGDAILFQALLALWHLFGVNIEKAFHWLSAFCLLYKVTLPTTLLLFPRHCIHLPCTTNFARNDTLSWKIYLVALKSVFAIFHSLQPFLCSVFQNEVFTGCKFVASCVVWIPFSLVTG